MGRWTDYDLEDFCNHYWREIAPVLEETGADPSEPPTHTWLLEHGYTGYKQAVEYHLDKTFLQFCRQDLGLSRGTDRLYDLDVEHERTRELAHRWAEKHRLKRKKRAVTTVKTDLASIDVVAKSLREQHGHDNLLLLGSEDTTEPEAFEVFLDVFDSLGEHYDERTLKIHHTALKLFYRYLKKRRNPVEFNPVLGIRDAYNWNTKPVDPDALSPEQVNALATVAETLEERTIVVLLCAAGLRRGEVAKVHRSMINFDPDGLDTPIIEFDERKNGPSTVNLVYGADTLRERIKQLEEEHGDEWTGHLFPSPYRYNDHFGKSTIGYKVDTLAERALEETDVNVRTEDGRLPTPQLARRFWYNQYSKGVDFLAEAAKSIANEQGSSDPDIVLTNYLSERRRVKILRDHMRSELEDAFAGTGISAENVDEETAPAPSVEVPAFDENDDPETPIDRFLEEESEDDSGGWLSSGDDFGGDEWGGATPSATAKVLVGGAVIYAAQLLFLV